MADEYSELCENMRFYGNMRFKQLTLFFAATGILLGIQFGDFVTPDPDWLIPIMGIIVVGVFWLMEKRSADFYWDFRRRTIELEKNLKFKQFTNLHTPRVFSATKAVHFLFFCFLVMWIYILSIALSFCT